MKNFLQAILMLLFLQCTSTQAPQFNETIIFENSVVQVRLLCRDTGSIDQSDWLKLSIKNKTSDSLLINEINFEINEGSIPPNRISLSEYRAGDKYVMLPKFYNLRVRWGDYQVVTISPHDNLTSSKYITNYASVYLHRVSSVQKICPYFNLKLTYTINNKYDELENQGVQFCFYWKPDAQVSQANQVDRLRAALKDPYYRSINYGIINRLITKPEVESQITDNELVEAILAREKHATSEECKLLMSLLLKRKAKPDPRLTEQYKGVLQDPKKEFRDEFYGYWDDDLFAELLSSPREPRVLINLLDMNAPSWRAVPDNKAKAYNWLAKTLKFDPNGKLNQDNFQNWSHMISSMSVSGDKRIIDYLVPLLDNKQEYDIEDWSKYDNYGAVKNPKPDILKIRVCDVAFVGLLRAIGKIQYQFDFLTSSFDLYIDRDFMEDPNPIRKIHYPEVTDFNLTKALKMIRLTPASKLKIKEYIENGRF